MKIDGLKLKETDRFAAVISILKSLGVKVRAEVKNSGKVAGREVVQLYASYPEAAVERWAELEERRS